MVAKSQHVFKKYNESATRLPILCARVQEMSQVRRPGGSETGLGRPESRLGRPESRLRGDRYNDTWALARRRAVVADWLDLPLTLGRSLGPESRLSCKVGCQLSGPNVVEKYHFVHYIMY